MRSRYTAFVMQDAAYLLETWHPQTRPASLDLGDTSWKRLDILGRSKGGPLDTEGTVEFEAFYRGGSQHENSRFLREQGRWLYHSPVA